MSDETYETYEPFLDGNAAAGVLGEVFAVDVTAAVGRCAGCGRVGVLADTRVYVDAPGVVVRCVGCDSVLLRVVSGPDRRWIDLRGLAVLEISLPAD
jgi:phage FluMu protein Com